jgi:hypothetical protein
MFRSFRLLAALGMIAACAAGAQAYTPNQSAVFPPRIFGLQTGDVPGWTVGKVDAGRRENNSRAQRDSRRQSLYFYRGSWAALGRTTGWYEHLLLYTGQVDAVSTILVSEFPDAGVAAHAYDAVTAGHPLARFFADGGRGGQWIPSAGIASGPMGCAERLATLVDFVDYGPVVAEINSQISRPGCKSLPDPGPAIARELVSIIRAASVSMVSTITTMNGLRLTLSIPERVYPLDALASVLIEVTNVTASPISLLSQPYNDASLAEAIRINELDDAGKFVPPPQAFQDYKLPPPPSPPIPVAIRPHQTVSMRTAIILWADHVQIAASMLCAQGMATPCGDVKSAPVAVQLTNPDPPRIDLIDSGGQPMALVRGAAVYPGALLYRSSVQCTFANGQTENYELPGGAEFGNLWAQTNGILFSPPSCPYYGPDTTPGPQTLTSWRLIVGWLNHSVGVLDYHAP